MSSLHSLLYSAFCFTWLRRSGGRFGLGGYPAALTLACVLMTNVCSATWPDALHGNIGAVSVWFLVRA
jgi:hypothetical protein